jgi:orotidine-5'-phosphate decarboxylase
MSHPSPFGARLDSALDRRGSLCVGIDPHPALLAAWGLPDNRSGLERFALTCAEAFGPEVAVVKPQSAFFEAYGSAGIAVLERTIAACRAAGALVLLDVKRGDIGTTMAAYARAYLDPASPLAVDAVTVSPYLGIGSLDPAFELAVQHDAGLFVLALTSNPEGPQFQLARTNDERTVAQVVLDELGARNAGTESLGRFGVVVGATIGATTADFSRLNGPFLVPGIGAQGGGADDVRRIFGAATRAVVPSASREVLRAGPDPAALAEAARTLSAEYGFLRAV